nr:GH25 family lysozyme [Streptomyces sp. E5N91]
MLRGLDLTPHQPANYLVVDYAFVFLQATEGRSVTNARLEAQTRTARRAHLITGFCHFLLPGRPHAQVRHFLSHIPDRDGDVLIVDWEAAADGRRATGQDKDRFISAEETEAPPADPAVCHARQLAADQLRRLRRRRTLDRRPHHPRPAPHPQRLAVPPVHRLPLGPQRGTLRRHPGPAPLGTHCRRTLRAGHRTAGAVTREDTAGRAGFGRAGQRARYPQTARGSTCLDTAREAIKGWARGRKPSGGRPVHLPDGTHPHPGATGTQQPAHGEAAPDEQHVRAAACRFGKSGAGQPAPRHRARRLVSMRAAC